MPTARHCQALLPTDAFRDTTKLLLLLLLLLKMRSDLVLRSISETSNWNCPDVIIRHINEQ